MEGNTLLRHIAIPPQVWGGIAIWEKDAKPSHSRKTKKSIRALSDGKKRGWQSESLTFGQFLGFLLLGKFFRACRHGGYVSLLGQVDHNGSGSVSSSVIIECGQRASRESDDITLHGHTALGIE